MVLTSPAYAGVFPFLIGKVLTSFERAAGKKLTMFPFLIGKVLTCPESANKFSTIAVFPFLIGKVLTFKEKRK